MENSAISSPSSEGIILCMENSAISSPSSEGIILCVENSAILSPSPGGIILCVCGEQCHLITIIRRYNSVYRKQCHLITIIRRYNSVCGEQCHLITIIRRYNPVCVWRTVSSCHHRQEVYSCVCVENSAILSPSSGGIFLSVENNAILSPSSGGIILCVCGEQCHLITIIRRYNPVCVWRTVSSCHHRQEVYF